jgi:two-component system, sensor histidine kinase and response regulator
MEVNPVEFDLYESIVATVKTFAIRAHDKGLELVCDIAPDVPAQLVGDVHRLAQIVVNLVGNARWAGSRRPRRFARTNPRPAVGSGSSR